MRLRDFAWESGGVKDGYGGLGDSGLEGLESWSPSLCL